MTRAERRPAPALPVQSRSAPRKGRNAQRRPGANGGQHGKILEAAAEFFAEQGFAAASTAALAARCGVSKALLFHYYPSKEAILFDLLDGYTRHLLDVARQAGAESGTGRLHALIRAFLAAYESSRTRHIVLLNDVKFLAPAQRERVLDHERELVRAFASALRTAYPQHVSVARAKPLAMMLFGMINWTFTWLRPQGRIRYADFAEAVIGMLESGISGAGRHIASRTTKQKAGAARGGAGLR